MGQLGEWIKEVEVPAPVTVPEKFPDSAPPEPKKEEPAPATPAKEPEKVPA